MLDQAADHVALADYAVDRGAVGRAAEIWTTPWRPAKARRSEGVASMIGRSTGTTALRNTMLRYRSSSSGVGAPTGAVALVVDADAGRGSLE